jgi:uncharacterized damage-inducible protein DinB
MIESSTSLSSQLRELARHMAWADLMVWEAVVSAPQSASDAKIADTLHHLHLVQSLFLQAWQGGAFAVRERGEFATLDEIAGWGREVRRGVQEFVDAVTADQLAQELRMPWAAYFEQQAKQPAGIHSLGESVLQVVLHTQHHRGQVCARLRELGVVPPTVDFIVWLWSGRPAARDTL